MTTESEIETEIQAKGLNAPRLTPAMIDDAVIAETYIHAGDPAVVSKVSTVSAGVGPLAVQALRCLTICILVLENGFTVTGEYACASPENFNLELGRKIAREKAREKIWPLLGFALRNKLKESPNGTSQEPHNVGTA